MIYLDNAATTKVNPSLKKIIDKYMYIEYGNPGSPHEAGELAKDAINTSKHRIGEFLKTTPNKIIFTSCGSEANTLAILGLEKYLKKHKKTHLITSEYEHRSVLNAFREMERRGFKVTYIKPCRGHILVSDVNKAINHKTGFVSIMYVNNEIGTINDVRGIYELCLSRGIIFHSDCVQAAGSIDINAEVTADMISISGHKLHAPKGVGCLYVNNRSILSNIICGGKQEWGIRPGTENVTSIAAFGEAVKHMDIHSDKRCMEILKYAFETSLMEECTKRAISFRINNFFDSLRTSKIISVTFPEIDAVTLVMTLSESVCISTSSACSDSNMIPSYVLKSCNFTDDEALSTVRISFSSFNTVSEVKDAARIIAETIYFLKCNIF